MHYWTGIDELIYMVPNGFRFPSFSVHTMYNLWIFGDSYHQISPAYDLVSNACKTNCSRTKNIINFIVETAIGNNIIQHTRQLMEVIVSNQVYNYSYPLLITKLYAADKLPKHLNDININTLYNRMKSNIINVV